jgi:hypothetical protein
MQQPDRQGGLFERVAGFGDWRRRRRGNDNDEDGDYEHEHENEDGES